jgi:hypothetical protein
VPVATYSLWAQSGGGTLAADTASYTLATQFAVDRPVALTGIWFYSPPGAASLPTACVLYDIFGGNQIAGTLNSSPSWKKPDGTAATPGVGWIKCAYNGTVQIAWRAYAAAVLGGGSNWYSTTASYWTNAGGSGNPGIANGPLSADPSGFAHIGQGLAHTGSTLAFPGSSGAGASFWVDVEVADISGVPASPTYSLFTHTLPPDPSTSDATTAATFGMQFSVSQACRLDAIWYLNSGVLPTQVGVFQITGTGTGTLLVSVPVPAAGWEGAGTYAWARIAVPSVALQPGTNYEVCAYNGSGSAWMARTANYWTTGPGASGITSGILSAPNNAGAVNGQGNVSTANAFTFPDQSNSGTQAFLDVEVALITPASPLIQVAPASGSTANLTATFRSPTTQGSCLVACVSVTGNSGNAVTGATLGGSADNWAQLAHTGDLASDAAFVAVWADPACAPGQTSVVIGTNAATGISAQGYVFEFADLQSTVAALLDQTALLNTHATTTGAPSCGPTATTRQAAEVWLACMFGYNATITEPAFPWARLPQLTGGANSLMASYQVVSATGQATYAPGFGSATFAEGIVVTLATLLTQPVSLTASSAATAALTSSDGI